MDNLKILSTPSTPQIDFNSSGQLSIKGKSLPEDPRKFYNPLFNWLEKLSTEQVQIDIMLDYVNTSSSKRIIELIKTIDTNSNVKKIKMNWFYETDDADMLEFGEIIQRGVKKIKTKYIECDDIDNDLFESS